jgi:perosamine synthetase
MISGNEWKYIKDCLDTGWVSSVGSYVNRFEEMVASYVGPRYAVATVNGTSALHVSLLACGVGPDDEVIVPALTFIAPVNAVRYCGANPVFIDSTGNTLCLDTEKVADFLANECKQSRDGFAYNKRTKRRIKALIAVHVFGHPVDMDKLVEICEKKNINIIEDATESLGSEYKGVKTGSFGKLGCFSFNGNKIITTGGGGMIVTNDEKLGNKARHLTTQARCDSVEYDHDEIGYNYRLTNIQAAIGVAQMEKLEKFIQMKRKNARLYGELLSEIKEVEFFKEKEWARSNYWFYTIKVPESHKNPLVQHLLSRNIQARPIWKPIHTLPMYKKYQTFKINNTIPAYNSCLNLPCSVNLKKEQIRIVVRHIEKYFKNS